MAWISGRGDRDYSRHQRDGEQVRRIHLGRGPLAELAALLDEKRRNASQQQAQAWQPQEIQRAAADQALDLFTRCVCPLAETQLMAAGFHRHAQGEWRRRRGSQAKPSNR